MIKYIEVKASDGKPILIKLDSIRNVKKKYNTNDEVCVINDEYNILMSYNELKKYLHEDERRIVLNDESIDFRIKWLTSENVVQMYKDFGNKAIDLIKEIVNARDLNEIYGIVRDFVP